MKKFLFLFLLLYFGLFYIQQTPRNTVIEIYPGESLWQVDHLMAKENLIPHRGVFFIYSLFKGRHKSIQPGEYRINTRFMSVGDILTRLIKGDRVRYQVTIPEGLTVKETVCILNEAPYLVGCIEDLPNEGGLFPSTYHYHKGDSRFLILKKMQSEMQKKLDRLWEEKRADCVLHSKEDLLILASIIEKETNFDHEKPLIASVFLNRLKKGMPLQADPTVIYGLECKDVKKSHLKRETPYNTYKYKGLPPTAICCPGETALEAVIYHTDDDKVLYFVANGNGHNFSNNLAKHNEYVKQLKSIRKRRA